MADRFYTRDPLAPGEYVLAGPQAHHLATVRRFKRGDRVVLFNGDGHDYPAEVVAADRKRVALNVLAAVPADRELPFPLDVAVAMPKGDRGDFLIEKLTELGVRRVESRLEKLQHAVVEASKQCGRNRLMEVGGLVKWPEFARSAGLPAVRVVLHTEGGSRRLAGLPADAIRSGGVVFAVGPEGGFTAEEVADAEAAGWVRVGLGPRVLRVETAAVAAAAWAAASRL